MSQLEDTLAFQLKVYKLNNFVREYKFLPDRRFRFDFADPKLKVAIEVEGGIYHIGGHSSITGLIRDMEKNNLAVLNGWKVLRFNNHMVEDGIAIDFIRRVIEKERE